VTPFPEEECVDTLEEGEKPLGKVEETANHALIALPLIFTSSAVIFGAVLQHRTLVFCGIFSIAGAIFNALLKLFLSRIMGDLGNRPYRLVPGGCGLLFTQISEVRSYGFPSGHCQSMTFFATFWSFESSTRYKESGDDEWARVCAVAMAVVFWLLVLAVMAQRNGRLPHGVACHTPVQILAGSAIGIALAIGSAELLE
jgi:membrane-associated phospholipid phosphatase